MKNRIEYDVIVLKERVVEGDFVFLIKKKIVKEYERK